MIEAASGGLVEHEQSHTLMGVRTCITMCTYRSELVHLSGGVHFITQCAVLGPGEEIGSVCCPGRVLVADLINEPWQWSAVEITVTTEVTS
jgi:hypothetical protein